LILWIDAQLSPAIAQWIKARHGIDAQAVRDLGQPRAFDLQARGECASQCIIDEVLARFTPIVQ
jgi:predicted nuclease of predicted toxin-antitoxin system